MNTTPHNVSLHLGFLAWALLTAVLLACDEGASPSVGGGEGAYSAVPTDVAETPETNDGATKVGSDSQDSSQVGTELAEVASDISDSPPDLVGEDDGAAERGEDNEIDVPRGVSDIFGNEVRVGCGVVIDPKGNIDIYPETDWELCQPILNLDCNTAADCKLLCNAGDRDCWPASKNDVHMKVLGYLRFVDSLGQQQGCQVNIQKNYYEGPHNCAPRTLECIDCQCVGKNWDSHKQTELKKKGVDLWNVQPEDLVPSSWIPCMQFPPGSGLPETWVDFLK